LAILSLKITFYTYRNIKGYILVNFNYNYNSHIYALRLNRPSFHGQVSRNWLTNTPDTFSKENQEGIPIETRAKIFSNEVLRIIEENNLTTEKLQQSIKKYIPNIDIKIISMENYDEFGINTKNTVAAATRPIFDKEGNLKNLDIYISPLSSDNKYSKNKYIENLTHEITHAMQFAEVKEFSENYKDTPKGHFLAFFQQNISNMLIDAIVQKTLVNIAKETKFEMTSLDDYEKFLEDANPEISDEYVMKILGYKDKKAFKQYVEIGFNTYLEGLMQKTQVQKDQFAQQIIKELGGTEEFYKKIKSMVAITLTNENEAYLAGCNARKASRSFGNNADNNDAIHTAVGLLSEALSS